MQLAIEVEESEIGETRSVILLATLLDADGDTIRSGIGYYVGVVVVANDVQAQISRICGFDTPIYLEVEESPEIP